ncbi:MAG: nucleotidyltransferase domain-containing protein [Desulfamplus sp.]|nr:nucleotidyltransferase domain-containing protein [Desulfamplus sp.]
MTLIEQSLTEIVNRLVEKFNPETIFLFGSHVWGKPTSDSDIDLLVILPKSDLSPTKRASLAYSCLRDIPYPLDILVKTRKEIESFAQVAASLENQILSKGKRLYG